MQLELELWRPDSVRQVLADYLAMKSECLAADTMDGDYRWRIEWLCDVFGEATPAHLVTYAVLEDAARRARPAIKDVTIKRRFVLWRAAVKYAVLRGVCGPECKVDLPPWLRNDTVRQTDFYTLDQFAGFRVHLPEGRFRRFADLGFWTGQHTRDLCTMELRMLDPVYEWTDGTGAVVSRGRWWRRNHKNRKAVAGWIPMEPELLDLSLEWLGERAAPEALLVGRLNNVNRHFQAAAARAGLRPVRPCLGLRSAHSTLLAARGYPYEYIRQVLAHEGEISGNQDRVVTAKRPSILTRHYLRPSPDLMVAALRGR